MKIFVCYYQYGGKTWAIDIWADSWDDAVRKVESLKATLEVQGKVEEEIAEDMTVFELSYHSVARTALSQN